MRLKKSFALMSCLVVLGLMLASCAPAAAPTPAPKTATAAPTATAPAKPAVTPDAKPAAPAATLKPAAEQPKYGGILTGSVYTDLLSLDPHQEMIFTVLTATQPVMNGMIEFDTTQPGWKIRPGLAERWDISRDGMKLTFYLHKGVVFQDGKPFTSADAKFSLERAGIDPPRGAVSPRKKAFEAVDRIETPDDYTLVINMKHPFAEIMDALAVGYNLMMPKHVIEPLGGAKIRRVEHVVGTGPFKLKSYDSGVGWQLVKNPSYYKKGLPYLDGIKYYVIKDESARFSAFRTRSVLIEAKSPGISPTQKEILQKGPDASKVAITGAVQLSLWALWMNTRHPGPVGDVRVRKALHLAIDRQRMQKLFAQTQDPGAIGTVIHPDSNFAIPPETIQQMPGFRQPKDADLAEAKRLLEEAKVPKDFALTLVVREGGVYRDQATIVAEELKHLGINAPMRILDTAAFLDAQQKGDFAVMPYTYALQSPSPHFTLGDRFVTGAGRNYEGVSDQRIDSLYAKEERSLDTEERKKTFWEMERILREEVVPMATFYWAFRSTAHWKDVKGYPGMGFLALMEGHSMEQVWLDK